MTTRVVVRTRACPSRNETLLPPFNGRGGYHRYGLGYIVGVDGLACGLGHIVGVDVRGDPLSLHFFEGEVAYEACRV